MGQSKRGAKRRKQKKGLFSGKGYNPTGSVQRAISTNLISRVLDLEDVSLMSKQDRADLRALLRDRQKTIQEMEDSDVQYITAHNYAEHFGVLDRIDTLDPVELYDKLMTQEEYFQNAEMDIDDTKIAETDAEYKALMEADDKWTILRRLATVDNRLNIDRAYASEMLKQIEDMIEENQFNMTYQDLADQLVTEYLEGNKSDATVEESLHPFRNKPSMTDNLLIQNRGFHGIEKAKQAAAYRTKQRMKNLSNFEPSWGMPSPIDWTKIK